MMTGCLVRNTRCMAAEHRKTKLGEFGAAMIHGGHVHGPQHPVGDVGRSWNLKKMPSSVHGHGASFPGEIFKRLAAPEYHYLQRLSPRPGDFVNPHERLRDRPPFIAPQPAGRPGLG